MNLENEEILDLTVNLEIETDPRECLINDYYDEVRSAADTLKMFFLLRNEGLIRFGDNSPWWRAFLKELVATVEKESSVKS